jgi:transcriptional regulator with GAF, ATPase, and Fis domain/tetratricopeptide (TPR) repeat protein
MSFSSKTLKKGLVVGDRYRIEELLGVGMMTNVYTCEDVSERGGRMVIKILHRAACPTERISLLSRQFSHLCRLRHPGLARMIDFGVMDDGLFVVQEFVSGKDIYSGSQGMNGEEILSLVMSLSQGVKYLHEHGIIHGNLKPSNAILSGKEQGKPNVKLLDFGLSGCLQLISVNESETPAYTAPEALMGRPVDTGSDMYSLGVLIYQLLTRRLPFEDADAGFLVQKHLQGSVDLRSVERLERGATLTDLLHRLLDKNPEQRPSCEETVALLAQAFGSSCVESGRMELEKYFSVAQFIGRKREMSLLRDCAVRVRESGRGWTVFLTGEAGSGKTRCMEELRAWALLEGWRVIEGSCGIREEGSYEPYRQILAKTEPGGKGAIFQFGNTSRIGSSEAFESSSEFAAGQFRDLLTRELVRRLSDKPTLLFLHDFHRADDATSTVLDYLSSDIQAHPVLMCISARSGEEIRGTLARVMELVARQQRGEILELEPLAEDNVGELVAQMTGACDLKDTLGTWMHKSIGGNPFFLEEMLKHLLEQELLKRESRKWRFVEEGLRNLEVPESVSAVLQRRLEKLSPHAAELAGWMALMNRPVSKGFLGSLMLQDYSEISEVLEELNQRQLVSLENKNTGEMVGFRHALISEVIRIGISKKRRQKMHQRIAGLLEEEYGKEGHLQELAMHYVNAGQSENGTKYALDAAELCKKEYADEAALQFYEYVLACRKFVPQSRIHEIAMDAAESYCTLGNPVRAISLLKKELSRNPRLESKTKAGLLLQLATSYRHRGDLNGLQVYAKKGLSLVRNKSGYRQRILRALLLTDLAYSHLLKSHSRRGLRLAGQALSAVPEARKSAVAGRVYSVISGLHWVACDLHSAVAAARESIEILEPLNQFHRLSAAFSQMGTCLVALGRLRAALEQHQRAVEVSELTRSVPLRSQALSNLGECLCRQGNLADATIASEKAVKLSIECGNLIIKHSCLATLAETKIAAGNYSGAEEILNELDEGKSPSGPVFSKAQAAYLSALLDFELGDFESTLRHLTHFHRFENSEAPAYEHELGKALKFRILYERGRKPQAIRSLMILDETVRRKHWPYNSCLIKLHLGECLIAEKEPESAGKVLKDAIRLARGMGSNPLLARARLLMGRALFQKSDGNPDFLLKHAKPEITAAKEISEKSGIPELTWRAHAELARIEEILSDWDSCLYHNSRAIEQLINLEAKVPKAKVQKFLAAFERGNTLLECEQRKSTVGSRGRFSSLRFSDFHEQQIRTLLGFSSVINSIRDLDSLLESIVDQLIQALEIERALVFLKEENTAKLELVKGRNRRGEAVEHPHQFSRELLDQVNRDGKPFLTADATRDPRLSGSDKSVAPSAGTILCAPLKVSGRILGVLYADHSAVSNTLNESTINMFATFCNLSAIAIDNALAHRQLIKEKTELEQYLHQTRQGYSEIVGKSRAVEALRDRIGLAAASPLDILITGESGTGKELVARAIHKNGRRKSGRFIPVDCGSLTDSLAEAELFGYRKGAFTGAAENRQGLLEAVQDGIVFLDEISNLPFRLQAKLLRVLQEREVRRIGENTPRKIDIQVVAATNKDLLEETKNGRFRKDLYYRLKAMEIRVPPLREHLEDVPLLIEWFLEKIADVEGGRFKRFSQECVELLKRYSYPGNIRELKNIVDSSYYSTVGGTMSPDELPPEVCGEEIEPIDSETNTASRIYQDILEGRGDFETLVKEPFLQHQFGSSVVRSIIQKALADTSGRYKESFERLRIPGKRYSITIQFLKRNRCYLDFRPFRRKQASAVKP